MDIILDTFCTNPALPWFFVKWFLFGVIVRLFYYGLVNTITTVFQSRSEPPYRSPNQRTNRLNAFHKKHMLLSYVMLSSWFISTYLTNFYVMAVTDFGIPRYDSTSRPVSHSLYKDTDEYTVPHTKRDLLANKIFLNELRAYAAAPSKCNRSFHMDSDSFDVCIDSGASSTCTMNKDDFIPGTFHAIQGHSINGISSGLAVLGYGTVRWVVHDDNHDPIDLEIDRALLIQDLPLRLLSPQQLASQTLGLRDGFHIGRDHATLTFGGYVRTISYHRNNKLPIMSSFPGCLQFSAYNASLVADGSIQDNLTFPQRQLLKWHRRLGHIGYHKIQQFSRLGILPKELSTVRQSEFPVCPACQFGKQKRSYKTSSLDTHAISAEDNRPGDRVSVDLIHSPIGGLIPQNRGKPRVERYNYACVFVDHATQLTHVVFQISATAEETVQSKHSFEAFALTHGIRIKKYRADNGSFNTRLFKEAVLAANQSIDYCAAYAHHQNSIAERMIQTITFRARCQLLHAMHCWPSAITTEFWPYPIRLVVDIHNNSPLKNGLCPLELFAGVKRRANLSLMHPFGCPAYVLDSRLCDGGKSPKWDPRSERGIYLGLSPDHASNVSLIFNPKTRHVSPQYHVVYDDDFTSVTSGVARNWASVFNDLFQTNRAEAPDEFHQVPADLPDDLQHTNGDTSSSSGAMPSFSSLEDSVPTSGTMVPSEGDDNPTEGDPTDIVTGSVQSPDAPPSEGGTSTTSVVPSSSDSPDSPSPSPRREGGIQPGQHHHDDQTPRTRGGRRSVRPHRLNDYALFSTGLISRQLAMTASKTFEESIGKFSLFKANMDHLQEINRNFDDMMSNLVDPRLYAASIADKDTLHYREAMEAEDREDFKKAMVKEVDDLTKTHVWRLVPKTEVPKDARLIRLIWSFKRKRNPLGELLKHKARLCVHGGMQRKGIDYWHTYAPVVNWSTVRMVLILTQLAGWCSRQIDYVLAFSQAPIDTDVYCYLPAGFHIKGGNESDFVLKLEKNLYGTKQAAANWYEMLKNGLLKEGFKTSKIDPCLFLRKDAIIVTYVDDCLIFGRDAKIIETLINDLKRDFKLTDEGPDVNAFLGIKVDRNGETGTITMSQPALTNRILKELSLDEGNVKLHDTPANQILVKNPDEADRKQEWNYRSVIGMMMFLASSTRPDILFSVHQCAKFNSCPKQSHEEAVKRIGRYLRRTRDKGIIMRPDGTNELNCYVDADFAGTFTHETALDKASVLSRTGYTINFSGCPILCVSKMQTEIALSTTEAEYIALSQSMRDLIPLRGILKELSGLLSVGDITPITHSSVFEDNNGALELAREPKYRPRTKHIAIKYHHFREHVKNKTIRVVAIDTKEQIADIFTKPLDKAAFEHLRYKLMGW